MALKIIACAKQVPDTNEVKIDPVKYSDSEGVPSILNHDDANALEEALKIKDQYPTRTLRSSQWVLLGEGSVDRVSRNGAVCILISDRRSAPILGYPPLPLLRLKDRRFRYHLRRTPD